MGYIDWDKWELERTKHSRIQIERLEKMRGEEITLTIELDDNTIDRIIQYFKYFDSEDSLTLEEIAAIGISIKASFLQGDVWEAQSKERAYADGVKQICEDLEEGRITKDDLPDAYDSLEARVYGY